MHVQKRIFKLVILIQMYITKQIQVCHCNRRLFIYIARKNSCIKCISCVSDKIRLHVQVRGSAGFQQFWRRQKCKQAGTLAPKGALPRNHKPRNPGTERSFFAPPRNPKQRNLGTLYVAPHHGCHPLCILYCSLFLDRTSLYRYRYKYHENEFSIIP